MENINSQPCWRRILSAVAVCVAYLLVGPTLIVYNNKIMHEHRFPYPVILSSVGVISCAIVTHFLVDMGYCNVREDILKEFSGRKYWTHLAPVGLCYCFALGLGNGAYLFLGVGFVQMLKAFTPVTLLIILRVSGVEIPTKQVVLSVLVIFIGTIVTTEATPEFNLIGLALVAGAEMSEAARLVVTQHLLVGCSFTVVEAQYFIAPLTGLCMLLLSALSELPRAILSWKQKQVSPMLDESMEEADSVGGILFLLGLVAILGTATNYLAYFVISQTGSLTLKALATVRNVGVVIYGALAMHEPFSRTEMIGYSITLIGFVLYSYFKASQLKESPSQVEKRSEKASKVPLLEPIRENSDEEEEEEGGGGGEGEETGDSKDTAFLQNSL